MKKNKAIVHNIGIASLALLTSFVNAEGTHQFGGATANQPLAKTTQLFVHVNNPNDFIRINLCSNGASNSGDVNDPVAATIYKTTLNSDGLYEASGSAIANLSSPKGQISCSNTMNSNLPATPLEAGANVMQYQATDAGVYAISLDATAGSEFRRWDVSLANSDSDSIDPTANTGNLFSYNWGIFTHSFDDSASATAKLYILVPGGYPNSNYVWQLDLQDFSGNEFNIVANDIGVDLPNSGFSTSVSGNSVTARYPVYLNYPKGANPAPEPSETPALNQAITFTDNNGNDSTISPNGDNIEDSGEFKFTADASGTYSIIVDLNQDGIYGNGYDKIIFGRMLAGVETTATWDGTDFYNTITSSGTFNVQLKIKVGEYHFVAQDVETSGGNNDGNDDGLTILKAIDESNVIGTQVFWNDNLISGNSNFPDGVFSSTAANGAHRHTWGNFTAGGIGNETFIDTFVYGKAVSYTTTATVNKTNTPPEINNQTFSINENTGANASVGTPVANDANSNSLTWSITGGNDGGLYDIDSSTGEITSTLNLDYETHTRSTQLTIQINDGSEINSAIVTINIQNQNEAPVISGKPATSVAQDKPYSFVPTTTDAENDKLVYSVSSLPIWASFNTKTGAVTGTPNNSHVGNYPDISISVSDGLLSDTLPTFAITVVNVNDSPIAINDTAATQENNSININPLANDSDPDGDSLSISAATAVHGNLLINPDNTLTYTPNTGYSGSDTISYTVIDGQGGSANAQVTVTVTPIELGISGSPNSSVLEQKTYLFVPTTTTSTVNTLTFTVTNLPPWATFSPTNGRLTGTPDHHHVGVYNDIIICVNNGAKTQCLNPFSISVISDLDQDGIADTEDDDIDGDGMSNAYEEEHNLNPYDSSDAQIDTDGDGVINSDEHDNQTDPNLDDYGPELNIPDDVWVNATELFTQVELETPTAFDYVNSEKVACCENATNNAPERFKPGTTEVKWTVKDAAGNATSKTQQVHVRPLISFSPDLSLAEGGEFTVSIYLNGESPEYPLEIPFNIIGGSALSSIDYTWQAGTVTLTQGTQVELPLTILADNTIEGDETIIAEIADSVNRSQKYLLEITIKEGNIKPQATLKAVQNNEPITEGLINNGLIEISSEVFDANLNDTHHFDWSESNNLLVNLSDDNTRFIFDPSNLPLDNYRVALKVIDNGSPKLSNQTILDIKITESETSNQSTMACNFAKEEANVNDSYIVEGEAGVCINRGLFSLNSYNGGVLLTEFDFAQQSSLVIDELENQGGYFNFTVNHLNNNNKPVSIVIPQRSGLPEDAVYRLFIDGQWQFFNTYKGDELLSAQGSPGFCPPPGDEAYVNGLVSGSHCVLLKITDGGLNDGDGKVNGLIQSTGGAHKMQAIEVVTRGGGSGSIHWSLLLTLLVLININQKHKKLKNK
ncbi:Ig-like domain-containing protein [Aliikangiella sp. IMCC44359]|uniref:Ig-like domain-containing protein n=1 Tax=Aliikangiella sp. IMCC44359 TaxID=3459125 RepID=UPI00403AA260